MSRTPVLVLLTVIALGPAACKRSDTSNASVEQQSASSELTRVLAKTILEQSPALTTPVTTLSATQGAVDGAIAEGLLHIVGVWPATVPRLELTAEGARFFRKVEGQPASFTGPFARFELNTPATRAVRDVTGIADSVLPGIKEVQFTWELRQLPDAVARLTGHGHTAHPGTALMRRYDDGWRVEQVDVSKENPTSYRAAASSSVQQPVQQAQQVDTQRTASAKAPTKVVATFEVPFHPPHEVPSSWVVTVSDVDVKIVHPLFPDQVRQVGFWEIEMSFSPSAGSGGVPRLDVGRSTGSTNIDVDPKHVYMLESVYLVINEAAAGWRKRYPDIRN